MDAKIHPPPKNLLGLIVRVPSKARSEYHWHVRVLEQQGDFIKVGWPKSDGAARYRACGSPWWTHRKLITDWRKLKDRGSEDHDTRESAEPDQPDSQ